jgi:7-keto-8-aminopelargonate synthetase and related enzymes
MSASYLESHLEHLLTTLRDECALRNLTPIEALDNGLYKVLDDSSERQLINLNSNDYLALLDPTCHFPGEPDLVSTVRNLSIRDLGSTSSRLLSGDRASMHQLEHLIAQSLQHEEALLFNSGYHANVGILSAIKLPGMVVLADRLVHASMIDGIRLSGLPFERFRHNDIDHLRRLVEKHHSSVSCQHIIVMAESIYSMDGDLAPLRDFVELKSTYPKVVLYIDEAHAIGVRGGHGYGVAEEVGVLSDIDLLIGTFGKALGSMGAYVACSEVLRTLLITRCRSLIYSTMLPPLIVQWILRVWQALPLLTLRRQYLTTLQAQLFRALGELPLAVLPVRQSHIVPILCGDRGRARRLSQALHAEGYFIRPIMAPTVPAGSERLRISITAGLLQSDLSRLCDVILTHLA